jgi:sterol desaturase/sphingolipid hydroxylase (fatty acid hydroxylase superfamily)
MPMKHLKFFGWLFGLVFACALIVLVKWHGEILGYAHAHRDIPFYLLLGLILIVPARIIALLATFWLELSLVGWSRSSLKTLCSPSASVRLDILSIFIMLLLPHRYLGYLLSFGLLYAIDAYAALHVDISLTRFLPFWILQAVGFLILHSFVKYWMHRMEHAIPAFWALHKFHHSADRMSILTSMRQTQLTRGLESGLVLVPVGLLTAPTAALPSMSSPFFLAAALVLAYESIVQSNGYLVHSNLRTDYGWIGRWLLVSPSMHRLHHAVAPAYRDKNFSFELVIWDRLFGTYAACDAATDVMTIPLGLDENPFNRQSTLGGVLREYFLTTYVVFWRELKQGSVAWLPRADNVPMPCRDESLPLRADPIP